MNEMQANEILRAAESDGLFSEQTTLSELTEVQAGLLGG
jgi:hypothetical protein